MDRHVQLHVDATMNLHVGLVVVIVLEAVLDGMLVLQPLPLQPVQQRQQYLNAQIPILLLCVL